MNSAEAAQAVAQTCPNAFDCVDVNLPDAISVLVLSPLFGVIDGFPGSGFLFVFQP